MVIGRKKTMAVLFILISFQLWTWWVPFPGGSKMMIWTPNWEIRSRSNKIQRSHPLSKNSPDWTTFRFLRAPNEDLRRGLFLGTWDEPRPSGVLRSADVYTVAGRLISHIICQPDTIRKSDLSAGSVLQVTERGIKNREAVSWKFGGLISASP